jgi:hypothetical protein
MGSGEMRSATPQTEASDGPGALGCNFTKRLILLTDSVQALSTIAFHSPTLEQYTPSPNVVNVQQTVADSSSFAERAAARLIRFDPTQDSHTRAPPSDMELNGR